MIYRRPINRTRAVRRFLAIVATIAALSSCTSLTGARATRDAVRIARAHELTVAEIEGDRFSHTAFSRVAADASILDASTLWVFIEGDGSPWIHHGSSVAENPTARNPLALRLMLQTRGAVVYLGRPCYLQAHADLRCAATLWTSARYSSAVVTSMNAALNKLLPDKTRRVVLVGYSGGGTLATLMARDNPRVAALVTIAANLDVAAWSNRHGYLPLTMSLNPATEPPLPNSLLQFHLLGERDENVPPHLVERYVSRLPAEHVWRYPKFDHVCCWEQAWPEIQQKIDALIAD